MIVPWAGGSGVAWGPPLGAAVGGGTDAGGELGDPAGVSSGGVEPSDGSGVGSGGGTDPSDPLGEQAAAMIATRTNTTARMEIRDRFMVGAPSMGLTALIVGSVDRGAIAAV
jgi:hypothetical protein